MATIKHFPESEEQQKRLRAIAEKRAAQQQASDKEHGRIAWEIFCKAGRDNIDIEERHIIARNLWEEVEAYCRLNLGTKVELMTEAGIARNHYDRVTLAPGKPFGQELHPRPIQYIWLMEAIIKRTDEDIEFLSDRVLFGTHFHPESLANLQEAQLILDALQVAVDLVDQEFNLWEQCQAIANIREPIEEKYIQAVLSGDNNAALQELEMDNINNDLPHQADENVQRWWPLEPFGLSTDRCPENAFWARPHKQFGEYAASVWSGESVLYFPHVYLGPTIEWRTGKPVKFNEDQYWLDVHNEDEPIVRFESNEYRVYLRNPVTGREALTGSEFDWGMSSAMTNAARWLVIYPDPEAKRLVPALFSRGEFLSTELVPLSARLIAEFGDINRWQHLSRDGTPSLLQTFRNMTGYGGGKFSIYDAWRETAARFHLNPIFKSHPGEAEKILYRRHLEKWIKEGSAKLGRTTESDE